MRQGLCAGFRGAASQELPPLLGQVLRQGDGKALGLALDLAVPPLALLSMGVLGVVSLAGGLVALGGAAWPLQLAALDLALFGTAVLLAWLGWGRRVVSLADLASVPFYVLAKIPLYLKFWTRRQKEWVRTERK